MTKKERVLAAIHHQGTDRVPKGEVYIEPAVCNRLLGKAYPPEHQMFERDVAVRQLLYMDLINVGDWPSWAVGTDEAGRTVYRSNYGYDYVQGASKHVIRPPVEDIENADSYKKPDISRVDPTLIRRCARETDLFVIAQICGPVSMLDEMFEMEDYMVYCLTNPDEICSIADKVIDYEIEKAKLFLDSGADAILMTDDIALNSGTFLPPSTMERLVFPYFKRIVEEIKAYKDVPVLAHSDGNLNSVLQKYVACGFDGLQSLQSSAGMDLAQIKADYGRALCLWGNLDLDYLMCFGTPEEVRAATRQAIEIGGWDGGFILSTCNTLIDAIPTENILAMIEAPEES